MNVDHGVDTGPEALALELGDVVVRRLCAASFELASVANLLDDTHPLATRLHGVLAEIDVLTHDVRRAVGDDLTVIERSSRSAPVGEDPGP
ncbi:MAG: hypothetical protein S0880_20890 [Actinomycetota bacterium]|nr:hypothetical protein [Actinomycetota bacterium]